jgi:hypothetical protein
LLSFSLLSAPSLAELKGEKGSAAAPEGCPTLSNETRRCLLGKGEAFFDECASD